MDIFGGTLSHICCLGGYEPISIQGIIKQLFPITYGNWGYASAYFVLYLLHPYINMLLNKMNQKEYFGFLFLLFIIWSVIPTFTTSTFQNNYFLWIGFLYSIGGYIRIWKPKNECNAKKYLSIALLMLILIYLSNVIFDIIGLKIEFFAKHSTYFYDLRSVPIVIASIYTFLAFKELKMRNYKFVNMLAVTTFGIYLIHENKYMKIFLWNNLENAVYKLMPRIPLFAFSVFYILFVFFVCILIEIIRMKTIERIYRHPIERISERIEEEIKTIMSAKWTNSI